MVKGDGYAQEIPKGSLVSTPTGRLGVVMGRVYGQRGDLERCRVRYLDSSDRRESTTLCPNMLVLLIRGPVFQKAVRRLVEDGFNGYEDDNKTD